VAGGAKETTTVEMNDFLADETVPRPAKDQPLYRYADAASLAAAQDAWDRAHEALRRRDRFVETHRRERADAERATAEERERTDVARRTAAQAAIDDELRASYFSVNPLATEPEFAAALPTLRADRARRLVEQRMTPDDVTRRAQAVLARHF
jgi:hypothetical protein